jgi:hypothetical protein
LQRPAGLSWPTDFSPAENQSEIVHRALSGAEIEGGGPGSMGLWNSFSLDELISLCE